MLYLINTPFEQSFSIPRSDRDVVSGEYTLILVDELDSVEHLAEITDVSAGNQYYTMSAKFPRGLHRGEFMYILRKGLAEVARGLVFVGDFPGSAAAAFFIPNGHSKQTANTVSTISI